MRWTCITNTDNLFSRTDTQPAQTTPPPAEEFQASSHDPWPSNTSPAPLIVDDRLYQQGQDWDWSSATSGELQDNASNSQPPPQQSPVQGAGTVPGYPPAGAAPGYEQPPLPPPPQVSSFAATPVYTPVVADPRYPQVSSPGAAPVYPQVSYLGAAPGYSPVSAVAPAYPYGSNGQNTPEKTDRNSGSEGKDPSAFDWSQLKNKIKRPFERISSRIQETFQSLSGRVDGGSSLPSLGRVRYEIKSALGLPQTLTSLSRASQPHTDPDPSPGLLQNLESLTNQKLKGVNQVLKNFISNSREILKSKTEKASPDKNPYKTPAYQTSYASSSSETVTASPIPVPIPTYLPVRKDGEFSAGFQVLMQYVVAMVGVAIVLAI